MNAKPLHLPLAAQGWSHALRWARLDEVCEGVFDCPHTTPNLVEEGPFVVRSQDIRGRVFDFRSAGRVSEETYEDRIARAEPRYGDLLYSREGTYFGIAAEVPSGSRVCLGQRMVLIRPDRKDLYHRFLLYWLNSPVMEGHLGGFRDGSVAERLNMATIRALPVPILPLPEQREIAAILGALDDKIELNRKTAATMEAMARALYRSWFVDFDPVWAKTEGRPPAHMDPATAALFPDSFGDDGLPVGWEHQCIGTLIEDTIGGDWGADAPDASNDTPVCIIRGTDFPGLLSGGRGGVPTRYSTEKKITKRALRPFDVVLEVSGGSPKQPTGRTLLITQAELSRFEQTLVPASFCRRLRPVNAAAGVLSFLHAQQLYLDGGTWGYQNQSTGISNFQTPRFLEAEMLCLPRNGAIVDAFFDLTKPLLMRARTNENQTLATLRDTLLPRLMSGELRVDEAREQVEAVA
ncbi:restriction endonuclease subunit S [Defluviimonas sp. WL0002]|uniref:Restriction endonuclease subunit S n=1 Tax=Albidovulum marisflavi TaxID=2984159 RepID=A0ABT2ZGY5_9RHOB|nr:restriction endonuclease subunit S [Defluviimonas sp. WL0002]MCV2870387.1 restriction endonuclease subunit S [Defluviimonas sp. WL0002]